MGVTVHKPDGYTQDKIDAAKKEAKDHPAEISVDRLSAKVAQLSKTQGAAQTRVQQTEAPKSAAVTNFDILKRLSNLEREVFGKKLDQQASAVKPAQPNPNNYTNADTSLDDNEKTRQF